MSFGYYNFSLLDYHTKYNRLGQLDVAGNIIRELFTKTAGINCHVLVALYCFTTSFTKVIKSSSN